MAQYDIIPAQGTEFSFNRTNVEKPFEAINIKTFTDKMPDFQVVQNFRFVWEKSREYLQKISENMNFKKLLDATIEVAKEDLEFGVKAKFEPAPTLDEKIRKTKNSMPTPKPNFK